MVAAGLPQQFQALPIKEDDRAQVDVELEIDELGRVVPRGGAVPETGVVDEHIEAPEALAMGAHDRANRLLVGHVGRDVLDVVPLVTKPACGLLERVGLPRRQRQPVALLRERLRQDQTNPP